MDYAALIGYSVLKKLHDLRQDILDAYAPFVEYALSKTTSDYTDIETVKTLINDQLALAIPTNTVRTILRRLAKRGAVKQLDGFNYLEVCHLQDSLLEAFNEALERTTRERNDLILGFRTYGGSDGYSDELILQLIADFTLDSLPDLGNPAPIVSANRRSEYTQFARYLDHVRKYDNNRYEAFRSIYYGAVLSKLSSIGGVSTDPTKADGIAVYLDSNILFRVLQLQNPVFNTASMEVLKLLQRHGFQVRCFPESVREMRSVLAHRAGLIRRGAIPPRLPHAEAERVDGIIGAFYRRQMGRSDIDRLIERLEIEIESLGIKVVDQDFLSHVTVPKHTFDRYYDTKLRRQIHSKKIDEYDRDYDLSDIVEKTEIPAYIHKMVKAKCELDTRIVACIRKWRSDRDIFRLRDSKAIFLTCDFRLYNFNRQPNEPTRIPEVMLEEQLTNILWVADPEKSGDVPLETVIAAYSATTFVDYRILKKLNDYLTRLREEGPDKMSLLGDILNNQSAMAELSRIDESGDPITDAEFESVIELARLATEQRIGDLSEQLYEMSQDRLAAQAEAAEYSDKYRRLESASNELQVGISDSSRAIAALLLAYFWAIPIVATMILFLFRPVIAVDIIAFLSPGPRIPAIKLTEAFLPELVLLWLWTTAFMRARHYKGKIRAMDTNHSITVLLMPALKLYVQTLWWLIGIAVIPFLIGVLVNRVA